MRFLGQISSKTQPVREATAAEKASLKVQTAQSSVNLPVAGGWKLDPLLAIVGAVAVAGLFLSLRR